MENSTATEVMNIVMVCFYLSLSLWQSKLGNDTLSSSGVLGEAAVVLTELERQAANLTLSPHPSDRRFTVHPLGESLDNRRQWGKLQEAVS